MPRAFPRPLAALLLDLDGTLVDTEHMHFATAMSVLERRGVRIQPQDLLPYVGWAEIPFWEDLKRRFQLAEPAEQLLAERAEAYVTLLRDRSIEPLPGVRELLAWAAQRGLPAAVASSSPRALIAASLRSAGLSQSIQAFRSGHEDAVHGKPAPDVYHAAARAIGVDAENCVALEDSPTGLRAALASGAFTIAVPCPSHPATPASLAAADATFPSALEVCAWLAAQV